jgi:hypothetical protein
MTQWKDEIEKKADGRLRVLIHHGKGKAGASESLGLARLAVGRMGEHQSDCGGHPEM